jgi:tetratricopeptide (TPR) repeat protein
MVCFFLAQDLSWGGLPMSVMDKTVLIRSLWIALVCGCAAYDVAGDVQSGRLSLLRGDPRTALNHFQRAAEKDPNYVANFNPLQEGVWTYVGRAYYNQGDLAAARPALERALATNKKDSLARLYFGLTILRQQDDKKVERGLSLDDLLFALREGVDPKRVSALVGEKGIGFDVTSEAENNLKRAGADNQLIQRIKTIRGENKAKKANAPTREQGLAELEAALKETLSWLENLIAGTDEGRYWDTGGQIRSRIRASLTSISRKESDGQKLVADGEWIGRELEEEIDRARRSEERDLKHPSPF